MTWTADEGEDAHLGAAAGTAQRVHRTLLKNLERDPRYAAFLKKMRLPL